MVPWGMKILCSEMRRNKAEPSFTDLHRLHLDSVVDDDSGDDGVFLCRDTAAGDIK